ncbi:MAG: hypothetical protein JWR26_4735, partial [Pedosphaera sp.]|nr:hypothetical protein [Pedosphaera sp.]
PPIPPRHITAPFLKATQPARRSHEHSSCRPLLEETGFCEKNLFFAVWCLHMATMQMGQQADESRSVPVIPAKYLVCEKIIFSAQGSWWTAIIGTGRRLCESGVGFFAGVGRGCVAAPGDGRAPLQRGPCGWGGARGPACGIRCARVWARRTGFPSLACQWPRRDVRLEKGIMGWLQRKRLAVEGHLTKVSIIRWLIR